MQINATRFPPVGHCIYCGSEGPKLSLEHIIPFGLNGDLLLPQASCIKCADITGRQVEGPCLRGTLLPLRTGHKLRTRRPRERPNQFPIMLAQRDNMKLVVTKYAPSHLLTKSFVLPHFQAPPVLTGVPLDTSLIGAAFKWDTSDLDRIKAHVGYDGAKELISLPSMEIAPALFVRMLAKIGHSFAYALVGGDGLKPYLPRIILEDDYVSAIQYVGSESQFDEPMTHYRISVDEFTTHDGLRVLGVRMRFFAHLGTPAYLVIVGESKGDKYALLKKRSYTQLIKHVPSG